MTILLRQFGERIGAEEEAGVDIDIGRRRIPFLAGHRIGVEDRPDRAAAVLAVSDAGQGRIDEVVGLILDVLARSDSCPGHRGRSIWSLLAVN